MRRKIKVQNWKRKGIAASFNSLFPKKEVGRPRKFRAWGSVLSLAAIAVVIAFIGFHFQTKNTLIVLASSVQNEKTQVEQEAEQLEKEVAELRDKLKLPKELEILEKSNDKWEQFVAGAKIASDVNNFPLKVILAQCALESARGTKLIKPNNFCGIGAYDKDPYGYAWTFENPAQTAFAYMGIIKKNFPTAWAHRDNPDLMIKYIKYDPATNLVYATDPDYVSKVMSTPEWRLY